MSVNFKRGYHISSEEITSFCKIMPANSSIFVGLYSFNVCMGGLNNLVKKVLIVMHARLTFSPSPCIAQLSPADAFSFLKGIKNSDLFHNHPLIAITG
jgi:hypothetical protein